ncbi:MAG: hypothetical protein R8G01_15775 [Ilumatobacteraceae bacterium]|nr:hypothetical protein [Ilumatobacteraceae bacterium]
MGGDLVGADADVLTTTARRFGRCSVLLEQHRAHLTSLYVGAGWVGDDAERNRREWTAVGAPALLQTSEFLAEIEARLLRHADEQRRASAATATPTAGPVGFGGGWIDDLLDDWFGGDDRPAVPTVPPVGEPGAIVGLRPSGFDAPSDGRGAVLAAMEGLADESRIGRDEIEIRALDNGRYVVVLPGVTDLSAGIDQFVDRVRDDPFGVGDAGRDAIDTWADSDAPTVRKMRYAYEAAVRDDTTVNEYSVVTIAALEAAGVPAGAEVMIIGHSFGAYTAMDLAADPAFNAAHGLDPLGYHVQVTHVVAVGAETDWRFDEVPADTDTLVLNNRFDLVYRTEDLLHRDGDAEHPGHLEQNFWGGWRGSGHDEHNYIDWLADTGNNGVEDWLDGAGARYTAGGTRVSAQVPDPNL